MADGTISRLQALIAQLQGAVGGKSRHAGSVTVTWPGGSQMAGTVLGISHGFSAAPKIQVSGNVAGTATVAWAGAITASTFAVGAWTPSAAPAAGTTETVVWEAWA